MFVCVVEDKRFQYTVIYSYPPRKKKEKKKKKGSFALK